MVSPLCDVNRYVASHILIYLMLRLRVKTGVGEQLSIVCSRRVEDLSRWCNPTD